MYGPGVGPGGAGAAAGGGGYMSDQNGMAMSQLHAAANGRPPMMNEQRRQGAPVEFNHAIDYVNKIKTRFANQPDIYKSFLEILQTYQRDQLRIAEVYGQVMELFKDAPDLLADFDQFLPESPHGRTGDFAAAAAQSQLPPVGSFAPPSNGRDRAPGDRKKKDMAGMPPGAMGGGAGGMDLNNIPMSNLRGTPVPKSKPGARARDTSSPTLVPAQPEPLPPPPQTSTLTDEIAFFDKVKKFIGNKQTYNEFLKVLNLFTQKIIDKNTLVERVDGFIGSNKELMDWFKRFVKYEGKPLHIENIVNQKSVLDLSYCKAYGPSYRLLPKSETFMPCSGRDEMCWEVLNDEWVVHPTWASEDSGFVAHRKNQYEEILYRVEEERHEYDHHIEANLRTIQILEAVANRIANMTPEEKMNFKLPPGLGHNSLIYQKVIKKIYDKERGTEVINALHDKPAVAVPLVLKRLKQKDEEWKRAHREWNKVWRETEQKVFYKSLDHQGLTFKQHDKKVMTSRSLVSQIMTVKAEQTAKKKIQPANTPMAQVQLSYKLDDTSVLLDIFRLTVCFLDHAGSYSSSDRERMEEAFRAFLQLFFSIPEDQFKERFANSRASRRGSPEATTDNADNNGSSSNAAVNLRKRPRDSAGDLLKDVLRRSKQPRAANGKGGRDDSSREASPDDNSNSNSTDLQPKVEGDNNNGGAVNVDTAKARNNGKQSWLRHVDADKVEQSVPSRRNIYNMFANTTLYTFMRIIQKLYCRLKEVKELEQVVSQDIASQGNVDFAKDLGLYDRRLAEMGLEFEAKDCYGQLLSLSEKLIEGDVEHQWFEESIRQAYRNRAFKLYTVDKVVQGLVKHIHLLITDPRTAEALELFQEDRQLSTSDLRQQILYRIQVKKAVGLDESMFRVAWDEDTKQIGFQYLGSYDLTLGEIRDVEDSWNYYMTSYMMSVPTEGVPIDQVKAPLLYRSMVENVDEKYPFTIVEQGLMARVCMNTYKLFFEAGTSDYFARPEACSSAPRTPQIVSARKRRLTKFLEGPYGWKSDLEDEEISTSEEGFKVWKEQGPEAFVEWKEAHKPIEPVEPEGDVTKDEEEVKAGEGEGEHKEGGEAEDAEMGNDTIKTEATEAGEAGEAGETGEAAEANEATGASGATEGEGEQAATVSDAPQQPSEAPQPQPSEEPAATEPAAEPAAEDTTPAAGEATSEKPEKPENEPEKAQENPESSDKVETADQGTSESATAGATAAGDVEPKTESAPSDVPESAQSSESAEKPLDESKPQRDEDGDVEMKM